MSIRNFSVHPKSSLEVTLSWELTSTIGKQTIIFGPTVTVDCITDKTETFSFNPEAYRHNYNVKTKSGHEYKFEINAFFWSKKLEQINRIIKYKASKLQNN